MSSNSNSIKVLIGLQALTLVWLAVLSYFVLLAKPQVAASEADKARVQAQPVEPMKPMTPANSQSVQDAVLAGHTVIEFEQPIFNFGTVKEGEKVYHSYRFTNKGDIPLALSNAKASCGCTVPKWSADPVPPGGSGEIKIEFDSKNRIGKNNKQVMVEGNFPKQQLQLNGEVVGVNIK